MAPLKLTNKDIDLIVRLVATETDPRLVWSHPEEYAQQVHGVVDTVLNRVASGHWGSTVSSVANAKSQFSAINGPKAKYGGKVENVPKGDVPAFLPNIVNSWITARRSGTPSSVGGSLHYANPFYSDESNLGWINALEGPKFGYGDSIHYHGTTSGYKPVEAQLAPLGGTEGLQAIKDRESARLGYGEIAPTPANLTRGVDIARMKYASSAPPLPRPRPDPNAPNAPVPATISPALQAARTRLAEARAQMGKTTANGLTPVDKLDAVMRGGASRLSDPLNVGTAGLNATPRLPADPANVTEAERRAATANQPPLDVSPVQARAIALDEGVGSLGNPRSFSPGTLNPGPKMGPIGNGATLADLNAMKQGSPPPVPLPRTARPATPDVKTADPVAATPSTAKTVKLASGSTAKVGDTAVIGGAVWTVTDNGDGTGKMVKATPGILGEANKNTIAGGVVREKMGEAITAGKDAAVEASKPIIDSVAKTTGDLLGQAGNLFGGLFGGATLGAPDNGIGVKVSVPTTKPKTPAIIPVAKPIGAGATLSAPGAGLSAAQRNAMSSLAGTGMANVTAPMPATMSPGLRTAALPSTNPITVSKPKTAAPATPAAPKLYQAGGYVYVANPSSSTGYTKVGKVAGDGSMSSKSFNSSVKSSTSTSSGVPSGYSDLGGGKFQSESGGIYYTRNL